MVLNLLRVEEVNPEIMLERSFYQYQNYAAIPEMVKSKYIVYVLCKRHWTDQTSTSTLTRIMLGHNLKTS